MEEVGGCGVFETTFASPRDGGAEGAGNDYLLSRASIRIWKVDLLGRGSDNYIIWALCEN